MKKYLLVSLLLTMFITTACGNEFVNEQDSEAPEQVEKEPDKDEVNEPESEGNLDAKNDVQTEGDTKSIVMENADEVIKLLAEKNAEELANYVHPEKGVLFSPFIYVDSDAVTFNHEQVKGFFKDTETYTWGAADGSGEPIKLTPNDYYEKFIYDEDFQQASEIEFDREEARGNLKRNINEVFPDSHTVEYYIKGTGENGNMDWKALNLVFQQDDQGQWKLSAIVHDQWTI